MANQRVYEIIASSAGGNNWICPAGVVGGVIDEIICIGGGAGGISGSKGGGGGGGALSRIVSQSVSENSAYAYQIGSGGAAGVGGGDTFWINNSTCMAKGGSAGSGSTGGNGGAAGSGAGTTKYSGGNGGTGNGSMGGGGGSCAAYAGNGNNGASGASGGAGGADLDCQNSAADTRGGGGNGSATTGVQGNKWGGGGGGGSTGGAGRGGVIILSYQRSTALTLYALEAGRLYEVIYSTNASGSGFGGQNSSPANGDTVEQNGFAVTLHNRGGNLLQGISTNLIFQGSDWRVAANDYAYLDGCTFNYPFNLDQASSVIQFVGNQTLFNYSCGVSNGQFILQGSGIRLTYSGGSTWNGGTVYPYNGPIVIDGSGVYLQLDTGLAIDLTHATTAKIRRQNGGELRGSLLNDLYWTNGSSGGGPLSHPGLSGGFSG